MKDLRVAFIPLVRTTFDVALANDMIRMAREALISTGLELIGPVEPVSDQSTAQAAAMELSTNNAVYDPHFPGYVCRQHNGHYADRECECAYFPVGSTGALDG
jgi:hypothetical protein